MPVDLKEARPQDMAIWRAILAGREGFTLVPRLGDLTAGAFAMRRALCLFEDKPPPFTEAQARERASRGNSCIPCRFVLFTHPFTGGRAVYSEVIE